MTDKKAEKLMVSIYLRMLGHDKCVAYDSGRTCQYYKEAKIWAVAALNNIDITKRWEGD